MPFATALSAIADVLSKSTEGELRKRERQPFSSCSIEEADAQMMFFVLATEICWTYVGCRHTNT